MTTRRSEVQKMAQEYGFIILCHNRQWRVCDETVTGFHQGGHFTGTLKQCLIWLAGYAMGRESVERSNR